MLDTKVKRVRIALGHEVVIFNQNDLLKTIR